MEDLLTHLYLYLDAGLISFYRITGIALLDYLIGTSLLALICVIAGEITVSLAIHFNRPHIDRLACEMSEKERLSMAAYQAGDKPGYRALNKEANDAWGKHFFTMMAYSAGIFWPIAFALGWMQTRFTDVEFPISFPLNLVFGESVGYIFTFIPLYILSRVAFKYMRPYLPYFRHVQKQLDVPSHSTMPLRESDKA